MERGGGKGRGEIKEGGYPIPYTAWGINLTRTARKWRKDRHWRNDRYTDKEKLELCDLDSDGEATAPPQLSVLILCVWTGKQEYYIVLKRETGLLSTDIHCWTRRQVSVIGVGADSWEQSSDSKYLREDRHGGHFLLLTPSTFALGSEKDFAIPVGLTQGTHGHTHETEALGSLTWPCLCQQHVFNQDLAHSLQRTRLTHDGG